MKPRLLENSVVALMLFIAGCREERVVIVPTHIRESADAKSAKVKDVGLGDVVRVRRADADPPGVLRADVGFIDEKLVVRRPFNVVERYVADDGAALWSDPERTKRKSALEVAEKLSVLALDPLADVDVVITGDRPAGYVSLDVLQANAPTRDTAWTRVQTKLRTQDIDATRSALEAMLKIAPNDPVAREMLSVLYAPIDWKKSRALIAGIEPPPPYVDAGLTRADAPGPAYVLASVLRMRAEPNEKSAKLREIPIGTAVIIDELRPDGWARIHVRDDRARAYMATSWHAIGDDVEVPTDVKAGFAGGYALAKYLTPTAPTLDVIEQRRKDAESRGMFDEAMLWAQRANELAPSHDRRAALIDAALQASRWTVAAGALLPSGVERPSAAVRSGANVSGNAIVDVDLAFAWGCRGDPRRALLVAATMPAQWDEVAVVNDAPGDDVCTTLNVTAPCPLCWLEGVYDEPPSTPEAIAASKRALEEETARVNARHDAFNKMIEGAREKFPDGPYLRVRTRPSTWPLDPTVTEGVLPLKPWLVTIKVNTAEIGGGPNDLVGVQPIPVPDVLREDGTVDDGVIDVWVPVQEDEALRFNVLFASDEVDVRKQIAPKESKENGWLEPNEENAAASWSRAADACTCGC